MGSGIPVDALSGMDYFISVRLIYITAASGCMKSQWVKYITGETMAGIMFSIVHKGLVTYKPCVMLAPHALTGKSASTPLHNYMY